MESRITRRANTRSTQEESSEEFDNQSEDQGYRNDRRFYTNIKRKAEEVFKESFGAEIDLDEVEEEFKDIDALEEVAATEVKTPHFPIITFYIALILDLLDFVQLTGIGWFVMVLVNITFSIILFILMFGKLNTMFTTGSKAFFRGKRRSGSKRHNKSRAQRGLNKFAIKYLKKYISRRLLGILVLNIIPFVGIFASNAFFVFLAHNKQKKIAQKYIAVVEKVTEILKGHYRRNNR